MSIGASVNQSVNIDGRQYDSQLAITAEAAQIVDKTMALAKNGTLTVRTDANTGSLTMEAGHGIITGDRLDIYWLHTDGVTWKCQRAVTAGTVATNVVPIDLGVGDNLPVAATAVVVAVVTMEAVSVVRDNMVCLGAYTEFQGTIVLAASDNTELYAYNNPGTGNAACWISGQPGLSNPITSGTTIAKVFLSNGSASSTANGRCTLGWN